jgi:MFS transporter, NNP family, nitrate/nitrite transporter
VGSILFPLFKHMFNGDAEKAWRRVCIVPAAVAFATGVAMFFITDDAPKGNYNDLKKHGTMPEISAAASFRSGALNFNSWLMFAQYACCFGVELTMYNAAALYFKEEFGQSTESAAAIASIFGWMNLVSRGLGGFVSDKANARLGMRGRILTQTVLLASEGALVIVFSQTKSLGAAIFVMVCFSFLVQGACGSTFGIVPYIDPPSTGAISGIVGAGGNVGALGFGIAFRNLSYEKAFLIMGFTILGAACLSPFIYIKGRSSLFGGQDTIVGVKTLTVPEPEPDVEDNESEVNA